MSLVEFDRLLSWSLEGSKTGESTKCLWVGLVEGTAAKKIGRLHLIFKECSRILAPPLIESLKNLLPWRKKPIKSWKYAIKKRKKVLKPNSSDASCLCGVDFKI